MKWTKIMAHRKTNFLFTYPILVGLSRNFQEGLFVWDGEGYTDFIMLTAEIWDESRKLSQRINDEPRYVDDYRNYSLEVCNGTVLAAKEISQTDVSSADDQRLRDLASRLFEMIEKVGTTIIQTRFDAYEKVKAYARDNQVSPGDLRVLIAPPDLSLLTRSQMELLHLICRLDNGTISEEEFEQSLDLHAREYRWVTTDVGFGIPLTKDDLKRQVEQRRAMDNVEEEFSQLNSYTYGITEAKEALLKRLAPPPFIRHLMTALADESFFRQYRRDTYSQAEYFARPLFEEIARRTNTTLREVYYLTPQEIDGSLVESRDVDSGTVQSRMREGVIFRIHRGQTEVISGEATKDIVTSELGDEEKEDLSILQFVEGETAFPGRARGIARVITSEADLAGVNHGDIFIGTQATPNLINRIIDRVAAIVTDEGDITSHAALVSWEHQLPCVVGTQYATKVFRNGDLVEVEADQSIADQSIVRKI
jgi:pyruvate,water dikinase